MKLYLTERQALENYDLTEQELKDLISQDQVTIVEVHDHDRKILAIYDDDLAAYVAERDITPDKFDHLRGNLMGMTEAALKYSIIPSTLSRWASQGVLEIRGTDGRKKLVDEADIAYLIEYARANKLRSGKKIFS